MMRKLVLCLIVMAFPSAAGGWQTGGESPGEDTSSVPVTDNIPIIESPDGAFYSGNIPSLRANEKGYEIWVIADHSKDKSVSYRESRQLLKFDCQNRGAALASWVHYLPSGRILSRGSIDQFLLDYEPVVPGSVSEGLMNFVCKFGPLKIGK